MENLHPNMAVLQRLDLGKMEACAAVMTQDFVWHYINPVMPELHGDYEGIEGFADFFSKLADSTGGTFKLNVISSMPAGDELVVTHVKDRMVLNGKRMEIDAVLVWRMVDGLIREAWDIPAVHAVTVMEQ